VALAHLEMFTDVLKTHDEVRDVLAEPLRVFGELGDEAGLARTLGLVGQLHFWAGHAAEAIVDLERAADHARRAGDREQESVSLGYVLIAAVHGPMPVEEALALCERMPERIPGDPRIGVSALRCRTILEAMAGRFDVARRVAAEAKAAVAELGLELTGASVRLEAGHVELIAGDWAAAERELRPGLELLERIGNRGHWVTAAIVLAEALLRMERPDEAEAIADRVEEWAMADDIDPQIGRRRIKARVLARRGAFEDAERLAREAVEIAERTDYLENQARARTDLAEVLDRAGRGDEGRAELERALAVYERKGLRPGADELRARLA
jgi:tetratricopeptide (TPR) repeat protein